MSVYVPPQSVEEVLSRYRRGERYFGQCELEEPVCDFRGVNLAEVDFSHSFMVADFRGATLKSANFTNCNVKTCDFRGSDLQGATFRGAALEGTQFGDAILTGVDFEGAGFFGDTLGAGERPDW